jgi:hypothetical protein
MEKPDHEFTEDGLVINGLNEGAMLLTRKYALRLSYDIRKQYLGAASTTEERILCAAITYKGEVPCIAGYRHSDCYEILKQHLACNIYPGDVVAGFLTSHNRFVSRAEAYTIARAQGQLLLPHKDGCEEGLISENLY